MQKLMSRKFLISLAAFLGSLGTSIAGLASSEPLIAGIGIICTMLSAAIYAASEAYVDAASVASNTSQKIITASSDSRTVVEAALTDKTLNS